MIRNKFILALFMITSFVSAQSQNSFSLPEAQEFAMKNNLNNQKANLDIAIAIKKIAETRAIGLPQISADGKLQYFYDVPTSLAPAQSFNPNAPADVLTAFSFGVPYTNSAGISASQLIFDGAYIVGLQASKTYKNLSINNQIKTEFELKESVKQAYYTVLVAIVNTEVLIKSLQSTQSILKETQALYEAGLVEEQSVDQLSLSVNELKTAVGVGQGQIDFAGKLLKLQMGVDIDTIILLTDNLEMFINEIAPAAPREFILSNHIDFKLMENNMKLIQLNLRKEKYSFMPSINVFLNHQQQNMNNKFDAFSGGIWYPSTVWGASLSLPILTSGFRMAKMSQAKMELDKSQLDVELAEQNLKYQSQIALSHYNTNFSTYRNQKANLDLAKKIYDKTIKKYKEGIASSLDLAQTQNQYLSAEGKYIQSMLDVLNSKSELEKSYGTNQ